MDEDVRRVRELEKRASLAQREGRFSDAEPLLREAIAFWQRRNGPDDIEVLNDEMNLAVAWRRQGLAARTAPVLEKVVERFARCKDPDAPALMQMARNNLATAYRDLRRHDRARDLWMRCLAVHEVVHGQNPHPERGRVLDNLSTVLRELGDATGAERYARRGLAEWRGLRDEEDADVATSKIALGAALLAQGRLVEAEQLLVAALGTAEALGFDPGIAAALTHVGALALRRGDRDGARACFTRALAITRKLQPENHPDVRELATSLRNLG